MATVTSNEWEAWHAFHRMRRNLDRVLDQTLQAESQVSSAEYETLIALNGTADRRMRVKELAAVMGWEKSRVSHQVARMEKRGLIERAACETDARGSWIELTPDGRRAVLGAMRGHNAALRRYFFDVLDADERKSLSEMSARVLAAIGGPADD